ncbi:hypothetical protein ACEXQD_13345 [Herbiconiux sp. P15]|uniref:hypothetical protein n=1 Tax=Herbiconiux liukaitaii TaxID=3342799 RepID=UPI0035B824BD
MAIELTTTHGAVRLDEGGRVSVLAASGAAAVAGDGVGADLVRAVLGGSGGVSGGVISAVGRWEVERFGEGSEVSVAAVAEVPAIPSIAGVERALGVDMTNWAVVVDETWIVKVALSWGGMSRAIGQLERLAAGGSELTPRPVGRIEWEVPGLGCATVALVTELMPGAADGWTWAVEDVLEWLAAEDAAGVAADAAVAAADAARVAADAALAGAGAGAGRSVPVPEWPEVLGRMTAELHLVLAAGAASAALGSETGLDAASVGLRERILSRLDRALEVLDGEALSRLRRREGALREVVAAAPDSAGGVRFPVHGDLHVGQFLRSTVGGVHRYAIVDFDGDPQHPDASTAASATDVAAVDLAHLLVSVDLVGSVVQKRLGRRDERVLRWAESARAALQTAYALGLREGAGGDTAGHAAGGADGGAAEPASTGAAGRGVPEAIVAVMLDPRVIAALEVEQFARELQYARRYLPRWEYAPDGALSARYSPPSDADDEESPWTPPGSVTT